MTEYERGARLGKRAAQEVIATHDRLLAKFNLQDLEAPSNKPKDDFEKGYLEGYREGVGRR